MFTTEPKYIYTKHFPKFIVIPKVIIIDQLNQTACLYEIQVTVIYSRAILVTEAADRRVKRVICKTWTRTLANSAEPVQMPQDAAFDRNLHFLLKLQEVKS